MTIKFPEFIVILSCRFKVIQKADEAGGSFNTAKGELIIGTKHLLEDPDYTFQVICHELLEVIYSLANLRYSDNSVEGNYKFFMDHKEFQIATNIFSHSIQQFIE